MDKVFIGYSSGGSVSARFTKCLLDLQAFEIKSPGDRYELISIDHAQGLYIQENRNKVVEMARASGADWLLQLDTDISFSPELLRIMMRYASPSRFPIVTGLYANLGEADSDGAFNVVNCIYGEAPNGQYVTLNPPDNMQPFEVDACGTGVFLTHLSVYDKIPFPWYWLALFKNPDGSMQTMNEDIAFCRMAKAAGCWILCDPLAEVVHWKTLPMRSSQFKQMYDNAMRTMADLKNG
jgi:GT2 family glycosyltransferase